MTNQEKLIVVKGTKDGQLDTVEYIVVDAITNKMKAETDRAYIERKRADYLTEHNPYNYNDDMDGRSTGKYVYASDLIKIGAKYGLVEEKSKATKAEATPAAEKVVEKAEVKTEPKKTEPNKEGTLEGDFAE